MLSASKFADTSVWTGSNGWADRVFRSVRCLCFGHLRNSLGPFHGGIWCHIKKDQVRPTWITGFRAQNNMQNRIWPRTRQDHCIHPQCRCRNLYCLLHWNGPAHNGRARWVPHLMLILRLGYLHSIWILYYWIMWRWAKYTVHCITCLITIMVVLLT